MQEEGWTQEETMFELLEKADFPPEKYNLVKDKIKLTTYESIVFKMSFDEYLKE
jgi:AMMECR1 domain-containing protein